MKRNSMKKLTIISIIIITFFLLGTNTVKANAVNDGEAGNQELQLSSPIKLADEGDMKLEGNDKSLIYKSDSDIKEIGNTIVTSVAYALYAVAIVVILITGVRFMIAAPEAKAKLKEQLIVVTVGLIIFFSIRTIIKIIWDLIGNVIN